MSDLGNILAEIEKVEAELQHNTVQPTVQLIHRTDFHKLLKDLGYPDELIPDVNPKELGFTFIEEY